MSRGVGSTQRPSVTVRECPLGLELVNREHHVRHHCYSSCNVKVLGIHSDRVSSPCVRASTKKKPRRDAGRPRGESIEAVVLARALEELTVHGLEGASVDRIARAADVNKTSVYRRFGTREALLAAALERVAVDLGTKLSDQGSLHGDLAFIAREVAALLREPLGQSLARAAMSESSTSEFGALGAREMRRPPEAMLAMVERARVRGEWRSEVSPEVVLAALVGAILHRVLLERAPLTDAFLRQLVTLLANGLRVES
jgi:AcrR family transcriptional regulator